jgi:LacI family transcriptional regulator
MAIVKQSDIAKLLNVSRITVSKALNDHSDISVDMKRKVRETAKQLGYIPHFHASHLHGNKTQTIGVVIPDVSNSFFSFVIHGIMDAAQESNHHIILTVSRESAHIEHENIMTLLSMRVDGLLVAISKETQDTSIFETVKRTETPLVFFDRAIEDFGFSVVGIDDYDAAKRMVQYLVDCGYRNIAHLVGSSKIHIGRDRCQGYLDVLTANGIPVRDEWIIEGGFSRRDGYIACQKLLQAEERPEAIFVANDRVAQGAYAALKEAGLRIPDDIGVAGFGHSEFADLLTPSLSIINVAPDQLGRQAMQLLAQEINAEGQIQTQKIKVPAELQIKGSTQNKVRDP